MGWRCQEDSLAGISGRKARVTALRCRRWSCSHCAPRLRRRMVALALAGCLPGERVRMLTLTARPNETADRSYSQLRRRWKTFRELLRRRFRNTGFEYFAVVERQGRGHAHLHVLCRGPYIPLAWARYAARRAGFGMIVDIQEVGRAAARYVAKYLGKEMPSAPDRLGYPALPKWHRRATWSRGWAPGFAQLRLERKLALVGYSWYVANGRPVFVADRLQRLGYELEEIDYGDVPPREQAWELRRQEPFLVQPAGVRHANCWLCASGDRAARRPHTASPFALRAAASPPLQLWPGA